MTVGVSHGVTRRPEKDDDRPFLLELYASTREAELAQVPWSSDEKHAFVSMQFNAQREHYHRTAPDAAFDILIKDGKAVGRLYLHARPDEIRIMDITLAPSARNQGLGAAVLQDVLREGARTGRAVTIHVERFNPARRLYERLGFQHVSGGRDDSIYLLLEWRPTYTAAASPESGPLS